MYIAIKTDTGQADVRLLTADKLLAEEQWEAGRQLSSQLLGHIEDLLGSQNAGWQNVTGVIVFRGPGSFTGLRIGVAVANAIAYSQNIPIVGARTDDWLPEGVRALQSGRNDVQVAPHYGAPANITRPGKCYPD